MIGRDEDGPSKVRPKVHPKDMIGRDEDGPSEVSSKESDWTKKVPGPYDDVSDLYVLPERSDWTRRNLVLSSENDSDWMFRWICLLEMLLIGLSDGSVFKSFLLTSFYFSFCGFIQPFAINKK